MAIFIHTERNEACSPTHQNTRGSVCQGAVGDVGVAGDPADVGRAPVHVVMVMIKNILEGQRCVEQVPGNSVENTLYRTHGTGMWMRRELVKGYRQEK